MLKLNKDLISQMRLPANRVIVRTARGENEVFLSDGTKLYLESVFAKEKHTPCSGYVVNICGDLDVSKLTWDTTNEMKVGDYCVFSYEASLYCFIDDDSRIIKDEDNNLYLILDYEDFFAVKRDGQILPINGYLLCSIVEEVENSLIELPKYLRKRVSDRFARVEYISTPNKCYYDGTGTKTVREDLSDPQEVISVGDLIIFSKYCDLPVEYDIHRTLDGSKQLYRMHRCYIKAVVEKNKREVTTG